jgi:hypothetical protein
VFTLLALASTPTLHWIQGEIGSGPTTVSEQAWFENPEAADQGVQVGRVVGVVVVPEGPHTISWVARSGLHVIDRGEINGRVGQPCTVSLETKGSVREGWLVISVSGIKTPLKVWIR